MPLDGVPSGYRVACAAIAAGATPPPRLGIWQWADRHIYLPKGTSPKVGEYRTDRVPMSREIMEVLSPHHPARKVVAMMSSQLMKTQVGLNFIMFHVAHDPQTLLIVYPTIDLAEDWSNDKFTAIARHSPAVMNSLEAAKSRDGSNTILKKSFVGGSMKVAGANTPSSLSSRGGAILYCDEVDRYPQSAGIEGDPITIAERALIAYQDNCKEYLSSTPTIESLSRINREFAKSDQRYYHVPCPGCGELQVLKWGNFKWDAGRPDTAHFVCEENGCIIREHDKETMLPDEHMGGRARWIPANPGSKVPGFHAWAAYASLNMGLSWQRLAEMWDECAKDPEKEKAYTNIYRGECFKDPTEKLDWEVIKSRAWGYKLREIPAGCLLITAGIDVQANRLACQKIGWGRGQKAWVIDYVELPGDPTKPEVWQHLDNWLLESHVNRFGVSMRVATAGVDSGYLPDEVLKFTRPRQQRGVFAIKGSSLPNQRIIGAAQKKDHKASGAVIKRGSKAWTVGSDTAKQTLFLWLQSDGKVAPDQRRINFSEQLPDEYFTMLCAEIYDPHKKKWVKQQSRNESLDTFIYAMAASRHSFVRIDTMTEAGWAKLQAAIEPANGDLFAQTAPIKTEQAPAAPVKQPEASAAASKPAAAPKRGGFSATKW